MTRSSRWRWAPLRAVTRTLLVGTCLVMGGGTAAAAPPFGGTMQEQFATTACPAGAPATLTCATVTGSGVLTHLGRTGESVQATINLAAFSMTTYCAPNQARATFTAANGDRLFMTTNGTSCQTGPGKATDSGRYQITGGTGRLQGAGGSGAYVTQALYAADMLSGTSVTTYTGVFSNGH